MWNNKGFKSGIFKLTKTLIKKTIRNVVINIKVNENHCCSLFLFNLRKDKFSAWNFINNKNIEEKPRLTPDIISFKIPKKNNKMFDGLKFNFLISK